jgi:uncharacterized protein YjbI with pentapeptide repeats
MGKGDASSGVVSSRRTIPEEEIAKGRKAIDTWMGANPAGAYDLSGHSLARMDLTEINFSHCNLSNCDLSDAILLRANLSGANLESANMNKVVLRGANLSGANLTHATLTRADLNAEDVYLSSFSERNVARGRGGFSVRAKLRYTIMDGAVLREAVLVHSEFRHASMRDVRIEGANLQLTDLRHCDLRGAKANSATTMNLAQVEGARFSKFTLASMNSLGGLTVGELGSAQIDDDVAKLRASYSGFWQWIHLIALSLFVSPYMAFIAEQWIKSRFTQGLLYRESISLGEAVLRFALTGVSPQAGPWNVNWSQVFMFAYLFVYNVLRVVVLWKTKKLELNEHVMGFPQAFHLRGGWALAYVVLKWGMIGNIGIVLVHSLHFLRQEVYLF